MKILFVCKSNFARSQIAEAFLKKFSKKYEVASAGTMVEKEWLGKPISIFHNYVVPAMLEEGIDLSQNIPKQLTKEMVDNFDKVVVMASKDLWPDYLSKSEKVDFWDILDPRGTDLEFHRRVRNDIKNKIKSLLKNIKP